MQSTLARRQFALSAFAVSMGHGSQFNRSMAHPEKLFSVPFAGSRTVSAFAKAFCGEWLPTPHTLIRAIEVELNRPGILPASFETERRQADFFASFAVQIVAPRHLRRAGYHTEARDCEQRSLHAPESAQCTIGRDHHERGGPLTLKPPRALIAYGCSAHASTTQRYATMDDIAGLKDAGWHCAEALLSPIFMDDDGPEYVTVSSEASWAWSACVYAINAAASIDATALSASAG